MPFLGLIVAAVIAAAVVGGGAYGTYNYYNGRGDETNNELLASSAEFDPGDVFNSLAPNGGRFAAKDLKILQQLEGAAVDYDDEFFGGDDYKLISSSGFMKRNNRRSLTKKKKRSQR